MPSKFLFLMLQKCSGLFNSSILTTYQVFKMSGSITPIESTIRKKLTNSLNPIHLKVMNESYMHNVPKGSETHFKISVVSDKFLGLPLIKRHRMIYDLLKEEMENGIHALSIEAKIPEKGMSGEQPMSSSPSCRGGFGL